MGFHRPHICVTDHGPAFSSTFVDYLQANHIIHHYSSYYRPQSNAPAERGVRSIKDVMSKIPGFSERSLHAAVFVINQHQAADGSGSPAERFFKQHVRSNLPMIMSKELRHDDLMRIRSEKQLKLAKKQGRSSDEFKEGHSVRIQDMRSGCWNKSGEIEEVRRSDDGQSVSFIIALPDGRKTICHRSHLRFNINRYSKITDTKVKFNLDVDRNGEERKKTENKKVVKPLVLKKSKSAECDWQIADNDINHEKTGISSRTRSKCETNMPEPELKSALKKRRQTHILMHKH